MLTIVSSIKKKRRKTVQFESLFCFWCIWWMSWYTEDDEEKQKSPTTRMHGKGTKRTTNTHTKHTRTQSHHHIITSFSSALAQPCASLACHTLHLYICIEPNMHYIYIFFIVREIHVKETEIKATYLWSIWTLYWMHLPRNGIKCTFCQRPSHQSVAIWTDNRMFLPLVRPIVYFLPCNLLLFLLSANRNHCSLWLNPFLFCFVFLFCVFFFCTVQSNTDTHIQLANTHTQTRTHNKHSFTHTRALS